MDLMDLASQLGFKLFSLQERVTCAESCTGGGLSYFITSIPKSSHWFERGFVTYSNQAKVDMLGVDRVLLDAHGAVSEAVAKAMVVGAVQAAGSEHGVSITGIAGPDGGTPHKPVGTVWIAWSINGVVKASEFLFEGGRIDIREQAIRAALVGLLDKLSS